MLDEKGNEIKKVNATTNEEGHLGSMEIDGKQVKVVNSCTMIEIVVHKLETGQEVSQVLAHDFMMVDHKPYMIRLLTDAINTVTKASNKKAGLIKAVGSVVMQKLMGMNREQLRSNKW